MQMSLYILVFSRWGYLFWCHFTYFTNYIFIGNMGFFHWDSFNWRQRDI